jgi:hypothetical protein
LQTALSPEGRRSPFGDRAALSKTDSKTEKFRIVLRFAPALLRGS